jgi:hypothetical protein
LFHTEKYAFLQPESVASGNVTYRERLRRYFGPAQAIRLIYRVKARPAINAQKAHNFLQKLRVLLLRACCPAFGVDDVGQDKTTNRESNHEDEEDCPCRRGLYPTG